MIGLAKYKISSEAIEGELREMQKEPGFSFMIDLDDGGSELYFNDLHALRLVRIEKDGTVIKQYWPGV